MANPSESLLAINMGYLPSQGVPATLIIEEDDEDITSLNSINSIKIKTDGRPLSILNRHKFYKKSSATDKLKFGDFVDLPTHKIEVAELENAPANASGYTLHGYTCVGAKTQNHEKNNLAYTIEVIGGYKKNLTDTNFADAKDFKNGIYVVEMRRLKGSDKSLLGTSKVYSYFDKAQKPSDSMWYYESNGVKTKVEKKFTPIKDDEQVLVSKKIR